MRKSALAVAAAAGLSFATNGYAALTQTVITGGPLAGYTATVSTFESSVGQPATSGNDAYSVRLSGYFTPNTTGFYDFAIATDDAGSLLLSSDATSANAVQIAHEDDWNSERNYQSDASNTNANPAQSAVITDQQSALGSNPGNAGGIHLLAGTSYYIQADETEGAGGDNLSVAIALRTTGAGPTDFTGFLPYAENGPIGTLTVSPVPEPATLSVVGLSALGLLSRRSRRSQS